MPYGMRVVVRTYERGKEVVSIVAPGRAVPSGERTIEALLKGLLACSPDVVARLIVIAARNTKLGAAEVQAAFPHGVRAIVIACYEKAKPVIASKSAASIILESRRAYNEAIATEEPIVEFKDHARHSLVASTTARRPTQKKRKSRSSRSESESATDSPSDAESRSGEEPPECCARVRVCKVAHGGPLRAEWVCYECSTKVAYSLLCGPCAEVHSTCDRTHEHETVHISQWPDRLLSRLF
jgi:hypothetical protein